MEQHTLICLLQPKEGNPEKVDNIKILWKKIEGKSHGVKLF
jgi:hypothetical protein